MGGIMSAHMTRSQRRFGTSYRHIKIQRGESRHHRKCRHNGGSDQEVNISVVPKHRHELWHDLFGSLTPPEIVKQINSVWLDPEYEFICIKKGGV